MRDMNNAIKARYRLLGQSVVKSLQSRKFQAFYCDSAAEAVQKALDLIPTKSSVSWGGSVTIEEIGLLEQVRSGDYTVIDRDKASTAEERVALMRQALLCDTYLTSFNAVSEDGVLINVDGVGNRVAAIAFGPKSVIAIVGMNKVCKTVEAAVARARTYAAPINAQRCNLNPHMYAIENTPCVKAGVCGNCKGEDCICSYIVETRMSKTAGRIKIILVGETLGF